MIRTLDAGIALCAALLSAGAAALYGFGPVVLSVACGGLVALANWLALRWLLWGMFRPGAVRAPRRVALAFLLGGKILALAAGAYALIAWAHLSAVPLAVGYSSLVVGLLGGAAFAIRSDGSEAAGSAFGGSDA